MKKAVVVGVSRYQDSAITPLPAARSDAEAMARQLEGANYGFDVVLLTDGSATRGGVLRALHEMRAAKPDEVIFFFAGHGARTDAGTAIVLHDATEYELGIYLEELAGQRLHFEDANVTMLLDCCHAGAVAVRSSTFARAQVGDLRRGLATAGASLSAIAACLPDEYAYEMAGLGHGLLTFNLLEGMSGLAADSSGRVTPTSLYTFVAALMNESEEQTPCFRGSVDSASAIGSNFPPRHTIASSDGQLKMIAEEAESHYDSYMAGRARTTGMADRREYGFLNDCRLLEEKMRWIDKVSTRYPDLVHDERFQEVSRALRSEQAYLCTLTSGTQIPGGRVNKLLGSGGFGSVWSTHTTAGDTKAFKVYHSNELGDIDKVGRFQTGYRANRQLTHPNIVEVYEERLVPLGFYMQAIDGPNLRDAGAATWDIGAQLQFLIDAAETVHYAHEKGVIHRDIKPENILVRWSEALMGFEPVVSDFDLAWFSTATQRTQAAMGMALYAPPEQRDFVNQEAVRKFTVDVFSFAQVLHFLITGRDPQVNQVERNVEALRSAVAGKLPASAQSALTSIYVRCSEYDPEARPSGFEPIIDVLRDVRADFERSNRGGMLTLPAFLRELTHEVTGTLLDADPTPRRFGMTSRTGRTDIMLVKAHDRGDTCGYDFRFRPNGQFGLQGAKNADLRRIVNQQLDRSLARGMVQANRRSGHEGAYEVFVDIVPVPLTGDQVPLVADVCFRAIRVMESMAS